MPLSYFLYRCPTCGHDPLEGVGDEARCVSCGTVYERGGEGGLVRIRESSGARFERSGRALARVLEAQGGTNPEEESGRLLRKAEVTFRSAEGEKAVRFSGELVGFVEHLGEARTGILELTEQDLRLWPPRVGSEPGAPEEPLARWRLLDIRAIQTSSGSIQIAPVTGGLVHFRFNGDSPYRWEFLLQEAVRGACRGAGRGEVIEFQPRIVWDVRGSGGGGGSELGPAPGLGNPAPSSRNRHGSGASPEPLLSWYVFLRGITRALVALWIRPDVRGSENIPSSGPFILVANHQSLLDPILVQGACRRPVHTFTKSTQFSGRFLRWFMTRVNGIPTRRYRIDPQVIRVALRRLSEGKGVGLYPEGERSWDGSLQPFRQGTIRFLLKAGVPIIPCGISGSYDVWPRWSRKIKQRRTVLRFGVPIHWAAMDDRLERDAAVPEAAETLRRALIDLGAWTDEGPEG